MADEVGTATTRGATADREPSEKGHSGSAGFIVLSGVTDFGVTGPVRRYALIVAMLVALASVPTFVVMAIGTASLGQRGPSGTPLLGGPGDPVVVVSPPAGSRPAARAGTVVGPSTSPAAPPPVLPRRAGRPPVPTPAAAEAAPDRGGAEAAATPDASPSDSPAPSPSPSDADPAPSDPPTPAASPSPSCDQD